MGQDASNQDFRILDVDCPEGIESQTVNKKEGSNYYVLTFAVSPTELSKSGTSPSISIATDNIKQGKLVIPVDLSW